MRPENGQRAPILSKIGFEHFKAIRNSGQIPLKPFTVFIGDNGSGKSSVLEALESFRSIVTSGFDSSFSRVGEFENAWNQDFLRVDAGESRKNDTAKTPTAEPMRFSLTVKDAGFSFRTGLSVLPNEDRERLEVVERFIHEIKRRKRGDAGNSASGPIRSKSEKELMQKLREYTLRWQFLYMIPEQMKWPVPKDRNKRCITLRPDASNIAEYLRDIRRRNADAYAGIIEIINCILPSVRDIRATVSKELTAQAYLAMVEKNRELPGSVMSAGTLRIIALLALLRDPDAPQLIAIDEIENGLDPRTIGVLMSEIRSATGNRRMQVIATSHSPYLIDQLSLDEVIVAERKYSEDPEAPIPQATFWRPSTSEDCQRWAESFSTGQIYTMDQLRKPETV